MLWYNLSPLIFLIVTSALPAFTASIPAKDFDQLSGAERHLSSLARRAPPPSNPDIMEMRICPVRGSNITVRFAPREKVVSAPRMHDILVKAITYIFQMKKDRQQGPDATFEFDGVGANKWYYIDVDQTPEGRLTWDALGRTCEGLLLCAFHRQLFFALHFEVWESNRADTPPMRIGVGEFVLLKTSTTTRMKTMHARGNDHLLSGTPLFTFLYTNFKASVLPAINAPLKEKSKIRQGVVNAPKMG
ncbi:MAG: hypothetical protein Q9208_001903 [Pyrenodesmia sp. 3 TL-2023]